MTREQAHAELRALAAMFGRLEITAREWAARVSAVIAEAYPDATTPTPPQPAATSHDHSSHRTSTRPPIPPPATVPPVARDPARAPAGDAA